MTVAQIVPKIAGAYFLQPFYSTSIYMRVVADLSSEIPDYGDTLTLPSDTSVYTTHDRSEDASVATSRYQVDSPLGAGEGQGMRWDDPHTVNAGSVDLVLNKRKTVSTLISYLQERQVRPSFLMNAARQNARVLTEQVNRDIRATIIAGVSASTALGVAASDGSDWGNDAHQTAIKKALRAAAVAADHKFIPRERRVVIMSPASYAVLVEAVADDRSFLVRGATDTAMLDGALARYAGWDILVDNSLGEGTTTADGGKHPFFYLRAQEGVSYAGELRQMRVFPSEQWMGNLMHGLYSYGAVVSESAKMLRGETTIS